MAEEQEKLYRYAVTSDGFNIWLQNEHVHAKDKVIVFTHAQNEELKKLIKHGKRPDITRELTYIDQDAAEKIAKEHLAKQPPAARMGAFDSTSAKLGVDKPKDEKITEIIPSEPEGMTLKERVAASREKVLHDAKVIEEGVSHAEDVAPPLPDNAA